MDTYKESRRSFRVEENIYLSSEVLTEDEFQNGLATWQVRSQSALNSQTALLEVDAELTEKLFLLKSKAPAVADCLSLINDKVTLVASELPDLRAARDKLTSQAAVKCELGADGMMFESDMAYKVGTCLVLQLLLETHQFYFETFARILRVIEPEPGENSPPTRLIAVEFHGMKPALRDVLIQHLFSLETETLRMRRLEAANDYDALP